MIFLYPTDTQYGVGGDATNPEVISKILKLKGRSDTKMLIAVDSIPMMEEYAEITPLARKLSKEFLPGKLSLVLNAKNLLKELVSETGTIGVRIPDHPAAIELIRKVGKPVISTSANIAGMEPENTTEKILTQFGERTKLIDEVIDTGELPESAPSTVVDVRGDTPIILREGAIFASDIKKCLEE